MYPKNLLGDEEDDDPNAAEPIEFLWDNVEVNTYCMEKGYEDTKDCINYLDLESDVHDIVETIETYIADRSPIYRKICIDPIQFMHNKTKNLGIHWSNNSNLKIEGKEWLWDCPIPQRIQIQTTIPSIQSINWEETIGNQIRYADEQEITLQSNVSLPLNALCHFNPKTKHYDLCHDLNQIMVAKSTHN